MTASNEGAVEGGRRGGRGRTHLLLAFLIPLTIYYVSHSRQSIIPDPKKDTSNILALVVGWGVRNRVMHGRSSLGPQA